MTTDCPALDTSTFDVTSSSRADGAVVNVTCASFGHRVVGNHSLVCDAGSASWKPQVPSCEWTWEFTTHEKVVLGTAMGCAAFIIVVAVITLIVCCCCRRQRRREEKESSEVMYGDNPGYAHGPGDTGGVYPDAYYAYQDAGNKHNMNGLNSPMDRTWLGYIPRPKVAEQRYYN